MVVGLVGDRMDWVVGILWLYWWGSVLNVGYFVGIWWGVRVKVRDGLVVLSMNGSGWRGNGGEWVI